MTGCHVKWPPHNVRKNRAEPCLDLSTVWYLTQMIRFCVSFFFVFKLLHVPRSQANYIQFLGTEKLKWNCGGWDKTHFTATAGRKSKDRLWSRKTVCTTVSLTLSSDYLLTMSTRSNFVCGFKSPVSQWAHIVAPDSETKVEAPPRAFTGGFIRPTLSKSAAD